MKKTILVSLIAALMLFAFVACDNSVPSVYNGVVSAEVQQIKGYFNGEEATEDGFQIVVNYAEGSPRIIPGNKGTIDLDSTPGIAKASSGIVLMDFSKNEVSIVPTEVVYSDVTSATVSGVDVYTVTEGWTAEEFDKALTNKKVPEGLENLTFTFTGDNVTRTYTLEDKFDGTFDYQLWLYKDGGDTPLKYDEEVKAGDRYEVMLYAYKIGKGEMTAFGGKGLATGMTVSAVEKEDPATVTGIKVYYTVKNGTEVIAEKVETLPALYTGDTVEISVYEVKSDNKETLTTGTVSVVNTTTPYTNLSFQKGVATVTVATRTNTVSTTAAGTVQIVVDGKYFTAPYSVAAGANYISNIVVAKKTSVTSVKPGQQLYVTGDSSVIDTTVTYKDNAEANRPATVTGVTSSLSVSVVPADLPIGQNFTTICTTTYTGRGGEAKSVQTPLTFTVAAN